MRVENELRRHHRAPSVVHLPSRTGFRSTEAEARMYDHRWTVVDPDGLRPTPGSGQAEASQTR